MVDRMFAAARLDVRTYEDIEADPKATVQAVWVVVIVSIASGIGLLGSGGGFSGLFLGVVLGVVQWAVWAFITYWIGTTLLRTPQTRADWGQLLRTLGFAQSPGVLRIFGLIPIVGPVIFFALFLWQVATTVVAVRQALDYRSPWRAVGVVVIGFIPALMIAGLISWVLLSLVL